MRNGEWKMFHNEEFYSSYRSPNIVMMTKYRILRLAEHVARMEEGRSPLKILINRPTEKRPLERKRHRWEDNIR